MTSTRVYDLIDMLNKIRDWDNHYTRPNGWPLSTEAFYQSQLNFILLCYKKGFLNINYQVTIIDEWNFKFNTSIYQNNETSSFRKLGYNFCPNWAYRSVVQRILPTNYKVELYYKCQYKYFSCLSLHEQPPPPLSLFPCDFYPSWALVDLMTCRYHFKLE